MIKTLMHTDLQLGNLQSKYVGKVREVYHIDNNLLIMVSTDRLSAFDVVLPKGIPYKGQILNQIATKMLRATEDIVPNWLLSSPDPNVSIGKACIPFKIEMVIRGYLAGHAARLYNNGSRLICGVPLSEGIKENDKLSEPIITPATKAEEGHDEDISREEIIKRGIVTEDDYKIIEQYTYELYKRGSEIADKQGLILVDTKYEFGKTEAGEIVLIDEIHTPDSSRYFYKSGYYERQQKGELQKQLSKEFVRQWLISEGFQGLTGQKLPKMNDNLIISISDRYIELYEKIGIEITDDNYSLYNLNDIDPKSIKKTYTLSLLKKTVEWVRESNPSQPITTGIYAWDIDWTPLSDLNELDQFIINSSDIISFHSYGSKKDVLERLKQLKNYNRPLLCTCLLYTSPSPRDATLSRMPSSA